MLWFFHPKPPNRKETAMQVASKKAGQVVNTQVIIVDAPRKEPARSEEDGDIADGESVPAPDR